MDRYALPDHLKFLVDERIKTYNNLAQAQIKLEAWQPALASLKQVLKLDPNNEKALYRKSKALTERGEIDVAIGVLRRLSRMYKDNKQANADLKKLLGHREKSREKEGEMSKKMLGLDKYEEEKAKQKALKWNQTVILSLVRCDMSLHQICTNFDDFLNFRSLEEQECFLGHFMLGFITVDKSIITNSLYLVTPSKNRHLF